MGRILLSNLTDAIKQVETLNSCAKNASMWCAECIVREGTILPRKGALRSDGTVDFQNNKSIVYKKENTHKNDQYCGSNKGFE